MGNTYSKVYMHAMFGVRNRMPLLTDNICKELYPFMAAIIKAESQLPLLINGVEDHIHLAIIFKPSRSFSDLMRIVKSKSSKFINDMGVLQQKFNWQSGFSVYSFGHSQQKIVKEYILNQREHHKKVTFLEEYLTFLKENGVDYDEKYVF